MKNNVIKLYLRQCRSGIFSQYMIMLQNAIRGLNVNMSNKLHLYSQSDIYCNENGYYNPFDYVISTKSLYDELTIVTPVECVSMGTYSSPEVGLGAVEASHEYYIIKQLSRSIEIKDDVLNIINPFMQQNKWDCNKNVFGVHIRTLDMSRVHPEYGNFNVHHFTHRIIQPLKEQRPDMLFVASDNHASIRTLTSKLNNEGINIPVVYLPNIYREEHESATPDFQLTNPQRWIEAFAEMLLLSHCNSMLCRTSNLSNAAIVFSDKLKNIYRL